MHFYTPKECEEWCQILQVPLNEQQEPLRESVHQYRLCCEFPPSFTQLIPFSHCIESVLQPRETCLLWVTGFGIFPSNENHHLYYRLHQSYGDMRLLHEAPGHLCLDYEQAEVVTLIYFCILFGWDVHLLPTVGFGQAFVCHDECVQIGLDDQKQFDATRRMFEQAGIKVTVDNVS